MTTPIPQPPALPVIGNLFSLDAANMAESIHNLSQTYGEIFKFKVFSREIFVVSSQRLINELSDERRFRKTVQGPLAEVRSGVGDGLFTAFGDEKNWHLAHRILVPAFGPLGINDMFDEMKDLASQLVSKWARMNPEDDINVTDDFTRLTLDSIALCAMDTRFNSFYRESMHPFVTAMTDFLLESGLRPRKTTIEKMFNRAAERKYWADIELMKQVASKVAQHRRENPVDKKDLLNAMLFGKDPKTGERLDNETIINNMITFLIAGHETTSGLLSFVFYYLMKNPEAFQAAQQEVDKVVGKGPILLKHMSQVPYIEAVMREALRLQPTAPFFSLEPVPTDGPIIIGGEYQIPPNSQILVALCELGRDPMVYGEDAESFKPERMYKENFTQLPPNSWKPFGNGARGCIGRPFAWQEAVLAIMMILQNFNVRISDSTYQLKIKQTLTIKPDGLFMKATLRPGIDPVAFEKRLFAGDAKDDKKVDLHDIKVPKEARKPMSVFYGSNSGTCEGLAHKIAAEAPARGFEADAQPLDSAVDAFPTDRRPVIIVTASYEGSPPDNATAFVEWLKNKGSDSFKGANYAVFGCGHKDWVSTFQKVPRLVDSQFAEKGGKAIVPRGETNVAEGKIFDDFEGWLEGLWTALGADNDTEGESEGLQLNISTGSRASHLRHAVQNAIVLKNYSLNSASEDSTEKRHMEFKLPTDMTYEAGDYLAVLPVNPAATVSRVLRRFNLPWDATMRLAKGSHTTIPTECELPISTVLGNYVELNGRPTKKIFATLAKHSGEKGKIADEADSPVTLLELLEKYPSIELPFASYLAMLPPMRIRQYSISSSPLADPTVASITYSVVNADGERVLGVATNYLRSLRDGATVQIAIKKSHRAFHLPLTDSTPVIMIGAGSGLAPFRGFVQERAAKMAAGKSLGPALLLMGCRSPTTDQLYAEQFAEWERTGAVQVRYAYSRAAAESEGCRYVQDRLWHERAAVDALFGQGARVYICGSGRMGTAVNETAARMIVWAAEQKGKTVTLARATEWWNELRGERFASDVFD